MPMIHISFSKVRMLRIIAQSSSTGFANFCDWFFDNKLTMHFGEDKIKSIMFASKRKIKKVSKQEIICSNIRKIL